jgi:hypothetical protein
VKLAARREMMTEYQTVEMKGKKLVETLADNLAVTLGEKMAVL